MDNDDLSAIREGLDEDVGSSDESTGSRYRFGVLAPSLLVSVSLLLITALLVFSVFNVGAVAVTQVGGIIFDADRVVGNDVTIYPHPTESAACFSNSSSDIVGEQSEVAMGALKADISQFQVPANRQIEIIKDIRVANALPGLGSFRIRLNRTKLATNPTYPPSANLPEARGDVPGSFVEYVSAAGIGTKSGPNDGYADLTFERSENVTAGDQVDISATAVASYDYSEASNEPYPVSVGFNPARYLDDVSFQSGALANSGTGDDGGYFAYTNVDNGPGNVSPSSSPGLTVDATTTDATYGSPTPPNAPYGGSGSRYIDDVTVDTSVAGTISNTNTGSQGGYFDYTNISTNNVDRDNTMTVTVEGSKLSPSFGFSSAPDPRNNYQPGDTVAQDSDNNACNTGAFTDDDCASVRDVQFSGISRSSGDDNGYFPDDFANIQSTTSPVAVGGSAELTVTFQVESDGDTSVSIAKAWIDWNQDGVMDNGGAEEIFLGSEATDCDGCDEVTKTVTVPVRVPEDAEPGSTVLRVVNAMKHNANEAPDSGYTANANGDDGYNIDHVEREDYVVNVNHKAEVDVFADWNQDGTLDPDDERVEAGSVVDKSGTFSLSRTFSPPDDALSGSSLFRVQYRNDPGNPAPNPADYIGETEDYTFNLDRNTNSAVHAFVDWNQNGAFDVTELENEDFPYSFEPAGWDLNGPLADISSQTSSSPRYSAQIGTNTTANQLVTTENFDTSSGGAVTLDFSIARGSDDLVNKPESGENILVEYQDSTGTWQRLDEIRADNFAEGEWRRKQYEIARDDALHTGFDVRFIGNGAGTDGYYDFWYIDEVVIGRSDEVTRIDTSTTTSGEPTFSGTIDVPPEAKSGSTLMRVVHQQDGYVRTHPELARPPRRGEFEGETEDYTVFVEPDTSFVRAWIDWNHDGDLYDVDDQEVLLGQKDGPGNTEPFTVSQSVTAPSPLPNGPGAAVLRVKHEQKHLQSSLTTWNAEDFKGENEDYTLLLSDTQGDISDTGNLSIGDSSLVISRLTADDIDLRTTLIDEDYADNTYENPRFGPDGEFTIAGDKLVLTNAVGILHQATFAIFEFSDIGLTVEYNPTNPSPRTKNQDACAPLGSYTAP